MSKWKKNEVARKKLREKKEQLLINSTGSCSFMQMSHMFGMAKSSIITVSVLLILFTIYQIYCDVYIGLCGDGIVEDFV